MRALIVALAVTVAFPAAAQTFPDRPIRMLVGFPAGGGVDIVARQISAAMAPLLGQPVVVENRGGAGGNIATAGLAQAPADGYTLLMGNVGTLSINAALYKQMPVDVATLTPIARIATTSLAFVIPASLPAQTLAEFTAQAKAQGGRWNYGSGGIGSITHLAPELYKIAAGVAMEHVPYRGSAPALTDLVSGQIQLMVDAINVLQGQIQAGTVRALAVTSAERSPALPAVPTAVEAGLPGFVLIGWQGVVAPAGTPRPVVERLSAVIGQVMAGTEVPGRLSAQGSTPAFLGADAFGAFLTAERPRWAEAVRASGATAE